MPADCTSWLLLLGLKVLVSKLGWSIALVQVETCIFSELSLSFLAVSPSSIVFLIISFSHALFVGVSFTPPFLVAVSLCSCGVPLVFCPSPPSIFYWTEKPQPIRRRPGIFLCPSSPALSTDSLPLPGPGPMGCRHASAPRVDTPPLLCALQSDSSPLRKSVSFSEGLLLAASGIVGLLCTQTTSCCPSPVAPCSVNQQFVHRRCSGGAC